MIRYTEYGNRANPTLVLLHGAGLFDSFARQYLFSDCLHIVVPHLYGAGDEVLTPYDPETLIHALAELVLSLDKPGVRLAGYGLGAELAIALCCRFEPLFLRAAFISPYALSQEKNPKAYRKRSAAACRFLRRKLLLPLYARRFGFTPEQKAFLIGYAQKITPDQLERFQNKRVSPAGLSRYRALSLPMLAVCGAREASAIKDSVRSLAANNPHCGMRMLKGAGPWLPLKSSEQLNPILTEFLF